MQRLALIFSLLASLCWPLPLLAKTDSAAFLELDSAEPTDSQQVTLFFWYGCDACKQLIEPMQQLQQQFPQLTLKLIPSQLRNNWYWGAKAFYCAEKLPNKDALHAALYQLEDWQQIGSHEQLASWLVEQGAPQQQVDVLVYSPLINQQLDNDIAAYDYPLQGVPSAVVNGHYLVDAGMVSSSEQMLTVIRSLLQQDAMSQEEAELLDALSEENLLNGVSDS